MIETVKNFEDRDIWIKRALEPIPMSDESKNMVSAQFNVLMDRIDDLQLTISAYKQLVDHPLSACRPAHGQRMEDCRYGNAFPALAIAHLKQEKKLQKAVEALEKKKAETLQYTKDGVCWLCREDEECSCKPYAYALDYALSLLRS
jgi:hypothetical protein